MEQLEQTLSSLEVAEMTGKVHKNLIRSIETYMNHFSQLNFEPAEYFKLSTYLDEQEKERKCYNITKKGCEFIAHKMTGIKGTEFTVKYIERFHEMEQAISQQKVVEQKTKNKSLVEYTPEKIVDWKLNDLNKRLKRVEAELQEKSRVRLVKRLQPKVETWYEKNRDIIWNIKERTGIEPRKLYHEILEECGRYYNLDEAKEIYQSETGRTLAYTIDLVEYFPQLQDIADQVLDGYRF